MWGLPVFIESPFNQPDNPSSVTLVTQLRQFYFGRCAA
jgi:hypothetical protein